MGMFVTKVSSGYPEIRYTIRYVWNPVRTTFTCTSKKSSKHFPKHIETHMNSGDAAARTWLNGQRRGHLSAAAETPCIRHPYLVRPRLQESPPASFQLTTTLYPPFTPATIYGRSVSNLDKNPMKLKLS